MNPIITCLECNGSKIVLKEKKVFEKKFTTEIMDIHDVTTTEQLDHTYIHVPYDVVYIYPNNIVNVFSVLTCYLPLEYTSIGFLNKFNNNVIFGVSTSNDELTLKFKNLLITTCDAIVQHINKTHNDVNFLLPYSEADKFYATIYLKSTSRSEDANNKKNKTHYNVCPIYYHQTKSKGGDVLTIDKNEINETSNIIKKEMKMFNSKFYMKKSDDPGYADRKDIHYVGKFVLNFQVELSTYSTNQTMNKKCTIRLVATEMEAKCNVTHCKSILNKDIVNTNVDTKELTSLTI